MSIAFNERLEVVIRGDDPIVEYLHRTPRAEARYQTLFNCLDEGVALLEVLFDADGRARDLRILETNAAFDLQSGTRDMVGQTVLGRFPDFEHSWIDALGTVAITGVSARLEGRAAALHRSFEAFAARVGGDSSRQVAIVFRDVSERKRAEAALRASEERHAHLLRLSDALRSVTDPVAVQVIAARVLGEHLQASRVVYIERDAEDGYHLVGPMYCAPGVASLTGRIRGNDFGAELIEEISRGRTLVVDDVTIHRQVSDADRASYLALGIRAFVAVPLMQGGRQVALIAVHQNSPRVWTPEDVALVHATGERTWAAVERARAEARQRDAEARLQLALDASNMGTFVWHVEEDRSEQDAQTLGLFGLRETDSLYYERTMSLLHADDRDHLASELRAASDPSGSGILRTDFRVIHPDGAVHWLAVTARMVFDEASLQPLRLVGTLADVTERKSIEAALREREERLQDADRRKDEFLAILAHELRTPLAPIRTGLELIRLGDTKSDTIDSVRAMMERQVEHMVRLIDDLLDVARITSGKIRLRREPASLASLVRTAIDANRAAVAEREIALRVALPEHPVTLDVDPTRFVQVLSNLLNNAVRYTCPKGVIEIAAVIESEGEPPGRTLALTVKDSGIGIPRALLGKVFDLFAQGEDSDRTRSGLGIGLALARRLVELHGGSIEAKSDGVGRGSTFAIRLPGCVRDAEAAISKPADTSQLPHGRRVVVIDDNVDAANSLRMFVTALGGDCQVAYDGERGVERVLQFRPDVVFLDIGMPRVDGYQTCRRIRHSLGSNITLIAISGWGQELDKRAAQRAGFDAHLTKPVDPTVLKELLAGERPAHRC